MDADQAMKWAGNPLLRCKPNPEVMAVLWVEVERLRARVAELEAENERLEQAWRAWKDRWVETDVQRAALIEAGDATTHERQ